MSEKQTSLTSIIRVLIREHRINRGLHQNYLSGILGISPSAYNRIETADGFITMNRFFQISTALQISMFELTQQAEKISMLLSHRGWTINLCVNEDLTDSLMGSLTPDKVGFTPSQVEYGCIAIPNSMINIVNEPIHTSFN